MAPVSEKSSCLTLYDSDPCKLPGIILGNINDVNT